MLSDQGMEDSDVNRRILEIATYCPFQTYLALLYAEIECVREWQDGSRILENGELLRYLEENGKTIDRLRKFRNSFLHPKLRSGRIQSDFLEHVEWYDKVPEIQGVLDQYLRWVNRRLFGMLRKIVDKLPKPERFACIAAALKLSSNRAIDHRDEEGLRNIKAQERRLEEHIATMTAEDMAGFAMRPEQAEILGELAGYMVVVTPAREEYQFEFSARQQPPMDVRLLVRFSSGAPGRYGDSRAARSVAKRIVFVRWLLAASAVMLSESLAGEDEHTKGKRLTREEMVKAFENREGQGLTPLQLAIAPIRLSLALLYEPLRCYLELKRQDPTVHDEMLSSVTRDMLVALRRFRNSTFHVPDHTRDPYDLDILATDSFRWGSGPLHVALADFFGPRDPT